MWEIIKNKRERERERERQRDRQTDRQTDLPDGHSPARVQTWSQGVYNCPALLCVVGTMCLLEKNRHQSHGSEIKQERIDIIISNKTKTLPFIDIITK